VYSPPNIIVYNRPVKAATLQCTVPPTLPCTVNPLRWRHYSVQSPQHYSVQPSGVPSGSQNKLKLRIPKIARKYDFNEHLILILIYYKNLYDHLFSINKLSPIATTA
jgi:hypothetical protein